MMTRWGIVSLWYSVVYNEMQFTLANTADFSNEEVGVVWQSDNNVSNEKEREKNTFKIIANDKSIQSYDKIVNNFSQELVFLTD